MPSDTPYSQEFEDVLTEAMNAAAEFAEKPGSYAEYRKLRAEWARKLWTASLSGGAPSWFLAVESAAAATSFSPAGGSPVRAARAAALPTGGRRTAPRRVDDRLRDRSPGC